MNPTSSVNGRNTEILTMKFPYFRSNRMLVGYRVDHKNRSKIQSVREGVLNFVRYPPVNLNFNQKVTPKSKKYLTIITRLVYFYSQHHLATDLESL
jgi:hypothetical protein